MQYRVILSSEIGGRECRCLADRLNSDLRRVVLGLRAFPKVIVVVNATRRTEDADFVIQALGWLLRTWLTADRAKAGGYLGVLGPRHAGMSARRDSKHPSSPSLAKHRSPDGRHDLPVDRWGKLSKEERNNLADRLRCVLVFVLRAAAGGTWPGLQACRGGLGDNGPVVEGESCVWWLSRDCSRSMSCLRLFSVSKPRRPPQRLSG